MLKGGRFYLQLFGSIYGALGNPNKRQFVTQQLIHADRITKQRFDENFVFIHINKTGGSSVSDALGIQRHHLTAYTVRNLIGEKAWREKFKFAFVRNPWDRVVSQYHYRYEADQQGIRSKGIEFDAWVRLVFKEQDAEFVNSHYMFMPQVEWICDMQGRSILDFVGRLENMEADFAHVASEIGSSAKLKHLRKSMRNDYRTYYDDETRRIVDNHFAADIEMFKYAF